ncbi:NAD(P)-dependent oxidoreductase [Brachybacterium endophyticum]|uniref:NAD(P)-dependent oxidoreductase n=1 Tax=Brachybacterium endophyticum TaxID=2182385 RepID=A0A2U2RMW8_9MICO|nr:NAD(P)-dependent oxidoreductase [Brachybacterium endophyticum]PWH07124.1 NAD(P)-dependent oxidoreductase [Brachybacterium endophyticum]
MSETTPLDATRIGWIGLGAMGSPMATLAAAAGAFVTAYDVNPRALEELDPRVRGAESAREAVGGCDLAVVMVATGAQLDEVLFGEAGIGEALDPGSLLLIMSTVGPSAVESAARAVEGRGVAVVDAPVSGGTARAGTGELLIMVGGPGADVDRTRPLLDVLAANAPLVGTTVGDGQRFKVVNQLLCGVHIAAAGEALSLADAMGLDTAQVLEVLGGGAAASFMLADRGTRMVAGEFDEVRSALDIFVKDMGLVAQAAREVDQPVPVAAAAEQLYVQGRRDGLGRKDDSIVYSVARGGRAGGTTGG